MAAVLRGVGVGVGLAVGPAVRMGRPPELPAPLPVADAAAELARARSALDAVKYSNSRRIASLVATFRSPMLATLPCGTITTASSSSRCSTSMTRS